MPAPAALASLPGMPWPQDEHCLGPLVTAILLPALLYPSSGMCASSRPTTWRAWPAPPPPPGRCALGSGLVCCHQCALPLSATCKLHTCFNPGSRICPPATPNCRQCSLSPSACPLRRSRLPPRRPLARRATTPPSSTRSSPAVSAPAWFVWQAARPAAKVASGPCCLARAGLCRPPNSQHPATHSRVATLCSPACRPATLCACSCRRRAEADPGEAGGEVPGCAPLSAAASLRLTPATP